MLLELYGTVFWDWIYKIGEDYETLIMKGGWIG